MQWGGYYTTTGTVSFPTAFTKLYVIIAQASSSGGSNIVTNRFPHTLTNAGFSHTKADVTNIQIYYIALGKKT